jgi:hypothetical protein
MTRWYKHGAVLAAWFALALTAHAQTTIPSPVGAARMIEPLGYKPGPEPNLVPGPITPDVAPLGPPDCLSLSANHTSAFQCEQFTPECATYVSIGAQGYQRNGLPHLPIVFQEPNNIDVNTPPLVNPASLPVLGKLSDINPQMRWGPRVTIGYLECNQAVEFTGFWIGSHATGTTVTQQGTLLVPFNAPSQGFPLGFEGNNGLWLNADQVKTSFSSQLGSGELLYRSWSSGYNRVEWLFGLRYINQQESTSIYTNDEFFVRDLFGRFDRTRAATYTATSRNNIVAPQIGIEYSIPCPVDKLSWLWLTGMGKAAIGPNMVDRTFTLVRGDGLQGFRNTRSDIQLGQIYEVGLYVDIHLLDRVRIRGGYQALFLGGTSNAGTQIDFNLNTAGNRGVDYGTQVYHGPTIELQLLF